MLIFVLYSPTHWYVVCVEYRTIFQFQFRYPNKISSKHMHNLYTQLQHAAFFFSSCFVFLQKWYSTEIYTYLCITHVQNYWKRLFFSFASVCLNEYSCLAYGMRLNVYQTRKKTLKSGGKKYREDC